MVAPARFGGLETVVVALTRGLATSGHEVHVIATVPPGAERDHPFLQDVGAAGARVHLLSLGDRAYAAEWKALRGMLAELAPDVVHTHGYRSDVLSAAAARRSGIPTVSTVHGFSSTDLRGRLYEWVQRKALARADRAIAVSRPLQKQLAAAGVPADRIELIVNALPPTASPLSRGEARERLGLPLAAPVVGWVGRLSPIKGPDVFLGAAATVARARPDVRFSVIGDGAMGPSLKARDGVGAVHFHGHVGGAARYLAAFDLLVMSSRSEGTPMVLLEAMWAGIGIVTTSVGGIPDVVGDVEATLVPPEDPAKLGDAILAALGDPDGTRTRAEAARTRVEQALSPERWVERHVALYRSLPSPRRAGSPA